MDQPWGAGQKADSGGTPSLQYGQPDSDDVYRDGKTAPGVKDVFICRKKTELERYRFLGGKRCLMKKEA